MKLSLKSPHQVRDEGNGRLRHGFEFEIANGIIFEVAALSLVFNVRSLAITFLRRIFKH